MGSSLERYIRNRIYQSGKITFAEYMELSLYHPVGGFYTTGSRIGPDFFTSPSVHPIFGASISIQLNTMWRTLGKPKPFYVIELGANNGYLGRDIKTSISPELNHALHYIGVDRAIPERSFYDIHRVISKGLPFKPIIGCIISNEFVDALPFHRFRIENGELKEIFVSLDSEGRLTEITGPPSTPLLNSYTRNVNPALLKHFHGEWRPEISDWIKEISRMLHIGYILTIDYGYENLEQFAQTRKDGSTRVYQNHSQSNEMYQNIGGQDITADVDFEQLSKLGKEQNIQTLSVTNQSTFLRNHGFNDFIGQLRNMDIDEVEKQANRVGIMELIKSPGLGDFKVMVQEKDTVVSDPKELSPHQDTISATQLPLLSQHHLNLMESRYPHLAWKPDSYQWPFQ